MLNRVYYDRSDIGLSDDVSISVESYDEKTDEKYRNCYTAEKCIVPKLSKISIPKCNNKNRRERVK